MLRQVVRRVQVSKPRVCRNPMALGADQFERVRHAPDTPVQRGGKRRQAPPVVDGAERFESSRGRYRNHTVSASAPGHLEQLGKKGCGDGRHIARHDRVPLRVRAGERSFDAGQWPASGAAVRDGGEGKGCVTLRGAYEDDRARGVHYLPGDVLNESEAAPGQQRLIAPHPPAGAPGQDEAGAGPHEGMITSGNGRTVLVFAGLFGMDISEYNV